MPEPSRRTFLARIAAGLAAGACPALAQGAAERFDPDYFQRMRRFDADHPRDRTLEGGELARLRELVGHLRRAQAQVGHGNFAVLGFDALLRTGRAYSRVGAFQPWELELLESIFYEDASRYGFYGEKVLTRITDQVPERETRRLPASGQFLYRGRPERTYQAISRALGEEVVLTSGVRGVVKQMYLFLAKAVRTRGNLSRASRSLAPPGYSFHGVGDFDVGQRGLGVRNFSAEFARTEVHRRLVDLGYLRLRYPRDNLQGVRYEPWHIRVV